MNGTYATFGELNDDGQFDITKPYKKKQLTQAQSDSDGLFSFYENLNKSQTFNCSRDYFDYSNNSDTVTKACFCEQPSEFYGKGYCQNNYTEKYLGCYSNDSLKEYFYELPSNTFENGASNSF